MGIVQKPSLEIFPCSSFSHNFYHNLLLNQNANVVIEKVVIFPALSMCFEL